MGQRVEGDEDVWWSAEEERDGARVSKGLCESWEEVLVAWWEIFVSYNPSFIEMLMKLTSRSSDTVVSNGEDICLRIQECELHSPDLGHATTNIKIGLSGIKCHAAIRHSPLIIREELPGMWKIGQDE